MGGAGFSDFASHMIEFDDSHMRTMRGKKSVKDRKYKGVVSTRLSTLIRLGTLAFSGAVNNSV